MPKPGMIYDLVNDGLMMAFEKPSIIFIITPFAGVNMSRPINMLTMPPNMNMEKIYYHGSTLLASMYAHVYAWYPCIRGKQSFQD